MRTTERYENYIPAMQVTVMVTATVNGVPVHLNHENLSQRVLAEVLAEVMRARLDGTFNRGRET